MTGEFVGRVGETISMTGFDPTAPARDTDNDPPDEVPGNVVPPEGLTESSEDESRTGESPPEGDGDVAPTGEEF